MFMVYDLIIIGGDSAGLTAGIYACRKKLKTIIITKQIGGQSVLTNNIENFPGFKLISGRELIAKERAQAEKYGAEIKEGIIVSGIKKENKNFIVESEKGEKFETKSIIVATGGKPRQLNISGEKEFKNKGVAFCSICDAPLFQEKDVVVIGSGNAGLESALDLIKYANKIYILESDSKIKGDEYLQERLKKTGKINFITNALTEEIKGTTFVEKIIYKEKISGEKKEISAQGVFINIGWVPATDFLKGFLKLNEKGEIVVNPKTMETSVRGIFAAGDVTDGLYKQNVIAAADGAKAALSAYNYLSSHFTN